MSLLTRALEGVSFRSSMYSIPVVLLESCMGMDVRHHSWRVDWNILRSGRWLLDERLVLLDGLL